MEQECIDTLYIIYTLIVPPRFAYYGGLRAVELQIRELSELPAQGKSNRSLHTGT